MKFFNCCSHWSHFAVIKHHIYLEHFVTRVFHVLLCSGIFGSMCVHSGLTGQRFSGRANLIQKSYREPKHFSRVTNHPLMQLMRLHCSLYSLITEQECMDEKISFSLESQSIFFSISFCSFLYRRPKQSRFILTPEARIKQNM